MPTFTRKVLKVEAEDINDLSSVAKVAHWRVTCDQDQSISAYGTQPLSEPNPDDFIDLSIVTETTVISWLGSDFWEEIEQRLSSQFLTKQTSTKVDKVFAGTAADDAGVPDRARPHDLSSADGALAGPGRAADGQPAADLLVQAHEGAAAHGAADPDRRRRRRTV